MTDAPQMPLLPNQKIRSAKPKRRWCQFSLKTLMIATLVFIVGFCWLGSRLYDAWWNRQRYHEVSVAVWDSQNDLTRLGESNAVFGSSNLDIETGSHHFRYPTRLEQLLDDPGSPHDPVHVLAITRVTFYGEAIVTDADLERLSALTHLKSLIVGNGNITDAGMGHLKELADLEMLKLFGTNAVSDVGLSHLREMTKLNDLFIGGVTDITDTGMEHLKGLTNLESLNFFGTTKVTDTGLEHLRGMKYLK